MHLVPVESPKKVFGFAGLFSHLRTYYLGSYVVCSYGNQFQTATRLPALLNAAMARNTSLPLHYWMVLGDNFYDKEGAITGSFFDNLSLDVKSSIIGTFLVSVVSMLLIYFGIQRRYLATTTIGFAVQSTKEGKYPQLFFPSFFD